MYSPERFGSDLGDATPAYSQHPLSANLLSSDFSSSQNPVMSTSRVFAWDYLVGNGRRDSKCENLWKCNDTAVGRDLMEFRDQVIQNNFALADPYEKL